jgi:transcriptional regulator with XRE-family HTH domain
MAIEEQAGRIEIGGCEIRSAPATPAISRIESGRHKTSVETLQRLARALGVRLVLGFESGPADRPIRELVSA